MSTEIEILGETNFKSQYEITLIRSLDINELILLIQGDESDYPQKFTHVAVRLETLEEHNQIFLSTKGSGGCQICSHHTELKYIANFALINEGLLVAMKHLGVCDTCYQEIEQAVEYTLDRDFSTEVTSEFI